MPLASIRIFALLRFIRWLIPADGHSFRLYTSLVNILIFSRHSVYLHFRQLKPLRNRARIKSFVSAITTVPDSGKISIPATLLARLVRTIHLTDVMPLKVKGLSHGGPNEGYADHPHFSYGDELPEMIRKNPKWRD